ncbi:MAG: DegQ family serine endoprotease [Gammaproteobacteria bacterium]|nr:DegQ family serine endoprotease [Gammaproteobacteria bacterium]
MSATHRRYGTRWLVLILCVALSATLLSAALSQPAQGSSPGDSRLANNPGDVMRPEFADIIEAALPSVVTIAVEMSVEGPQRLNFPRGRGPGNDELFQRFFGREFAMPQPPAARVHGAGSGFIIDDAGYIVTNHHVVKDADRIVVTLHDGREFLAEVLGTDPKTDLAVLEIDADGLVEVRFGDSDLARIGDWVVAIGNPFGLGGTATVGIISARGRDIHSGPYDDFLQIDAPINHGNSGGPVFNTRGEVIGVSTAIFSPNGGNVGIGFAIPARQAARITSQLRADGTVDRGWLGVQLQPMDATLAESFGLDAATGALVADVVSGSPAAEAGVEVGDVIIEFDGQPVESAKGLSHLVADAASLEEVRLEVWRHGKPKTLRVTLGKVDEPVRVSKSVDSPSAIGLELAPLDHTLRARLRLGDEVEGAVVARVESDSEAAKQGLRAGDVILSVDHHAVDSPHDVTQAIERARGEGRKSVVLLLRRGDSQRFTALSIA